MAGRTGAEWLLGQRVAGQVTGGRYDDGRVVRRRAADPTAGDQPGTGWPIRHRVATLGSKWAGQAAGGRSDGGRPIQRPVATPAASCRAGGG
ncbi:hypothetical protein [Streptomyces sp. NPDC004100]